MRPDSVEFAPSDRYLAVLPPHQFVVPPLAARGRISLPREELIAWGERLGRAVHAPLVVGLSGELGAGKTTLVQAICRGCGVTEQVTSPTFALVHEYRSPRFPVYHLDLHRLSDSNDLTALGWDDIVSAHAVVLVEWPEHAGARWPEDAMLLELEHLPDDPDRRLLLAG